MPKKRIEVDATPISSALEKAMRPSEEIADAANKLRRLLLRYSIAQVGELNLMRVILVLRAVTTAINDWQRKAPEIE